MSQQERRRAEGEGAGRLIRSAILEQVGVPHGFTTRLGGVSAGIFSSLNFGNPGELTADERDPPANIAANFRLVLDDLGARQREVVQVHQVHGAAVHVVRRGSPPRPGGRDEKADAIVTNNPARMVAVRVADCAPVLIASADGTVVAAVHAGWRGVIGGVAAAACAVMQREFGATALFAAIGPCISGEQFEVGPEVAAEFARAFAGVPGVVHPAGTVGPKPHVDLKAALGQQLHAAGVEIVETLSHCTFAGAELFYSHRRERGMTGRMVALIGPRAVEGATNPRERITPAR